jgi:hypothetical protein
VNGFEPVVMDEPEQTLCNAIAEMTGSQVCRSPLAKRLEVAELLQDLHQDDGDKHAYDDAARLHRGKDPDPLDHDVPQAQFGIQQLFHDNL